MDTLKKIVIGVLVVLAVLSMWFGAVQPWRKARSYITAIHTLPSMESVEDFEVTFGRSLSLPSPVGQEEIVKFLGSDVVGDIVMQEHIPEEIAVALVSFVESHFIEGNVFHSLAAGLLHNLLWERYRREEHFVRAEGYYRALLAMGPKLPPALYSLFELYGSHGDMEKRREIAETILRYWPDDEDVKKTL